MINGKGQFSIITCSDTRSLAEDTAGLALKELIELQNWECINHYVVIDDKEQIKEALLKETSIDGIDVVLTCGGSGLSLRDVTPDATAEVCEREVPGIAEAMRAYSMQKTPNAALSRARCMQKGRVLVINLPGSKKAAIENFEGVLPILPHAISMMAGEGH